MSTEAAACPHCGAPAATFPAEPDLKKPGLVWTAPPGWPLPPGFEPEEDWGPSQSWPAAPEGWRFWRTPDDAAVARRKMITPAGRIIALLGLAGVVVGLIVGFGMSVSSVGVDGSSLEDLAAAHPVNCGTAFAPDWQSVNCDQALSGRKTAAEVLLIGGVLVAGGAGLLLRQPAS